jgi:hypothetical protein
MKVPTFPGLLTFVAFEVVTSQTAPGELASTSSNPLTLGLFTTPEIQQPIRLEITGKVSPLEFLQSLNINLRQIPTWLS